MLSESMAMDDEDIESPGSNDIGLQRATTAPAELQQASSPPLLPPPPVAVIRAATDIPVSNCENLEEPSVVEEDARSRSSTGASNGAGDELVSRMLAAVDAGKCVSACVRR